LGNYFHNNEGLIERIIVKFYPTLVNKLNSYCLRIGIYIGCFNKYKAIIVAAHLLA